MRKVKSEEGRVKNEEGKVKICHPHSIPLQQDPHHNKVLTTTRSLPQQDPYLNKILAPTSQTINNNNKQ